MTGPISEITTLDVLDIINAQEAHRAADGPRTADPHQAVLRLGASTSMSTA